MSMAFFRFSVPKPFSILLEELALRVLYPKVQRSRLSLMPIPLLVQTLRHLEESVGLSRSSICPSPRFDP